MSKSPDELRGWGQYSEAARQWRAVTFAEARAALVQAVENVIAKNPDMVGYEAEDRDQALGARVGAKDVLREYDRLMESEK